MKPLTIEELKALEVGDWVWVVDLVTGEDTGYAQIEDDWAQDCDWNNYGIRWIAYKNKEAVVSVGDKVYYLFDGKLEEYTINGVSCDRGGWFFTVDDEEDSKIYFDDKEIGVTIFPNCNVLEAVFKAQ